jgi:hypothetical protein
VSGIGPRKAAGEREASDTEVVREAGVRAGHPAHRVGGAVKPRSPTTGGKTTIADRIVALLPEYGHYAEPVGSLAVLLAKPPSRMKTVRTPIQITSRSHSSQVTRSSAQVLQAEARGQRPGLSQRPGLPHLAITE